MRKSNYTTVLERYAPLDLIKEEAEKSNIQITAMKYVVELDICVEDPLTAMSTDRLIVTDTREAAIDYIKNNLAFNVCQYQNSGVHVDDFTVTDLDTIVKFTDTKNNSTWYWHYNIYPVPYYDGERCKKNS